MPGTIWLDLILVEEPQIDSAWSRKPGSRGHVKTIVTCLYDEELKGLTEFIYM